jgi:cell division protease FtsH
MADALMRFETIDKDQSDDIMAGRPGRAVTPAPTDRRAPPPAPTAPRAGPQGHGAGSSRHPARRHGH